MEYGQRYCKSEDMEDWVPVMGYVCAQCGTPARGSCVGRVEWGCPVCEFASSHTFHSLPNKKPPLFVTPDRFQSMSRRIPMTRRQRRMKS